MFTIDKEVVGTQAKLVACGAIEESAMANGFWIQGPLCKYLTIEVDPWIMMSQQEKIIPQLENVLKVQEQEGGKEITLKLKGNADREFWDTELKRLGFTGGDDIYRRILPTE